MVTSRSGKSGAASCAVASDSSKWPRAHQGGNEIDEQKTKDPTMRRCPQPRRQGAPFGDGGFHIALAHGQFHHVDARRQCGPLRAHCLVQPLCLTQNRARLVISVVMCMEAPCAPPHTDCHTTRTGPLEERAPLLYGLLRATDIAQFEPQEGKRDLRRTQAGALSDLSKEPRRIFQRAACHHRVVLAVQHTQPVTQLRLDQRRRIWPHMLQRGLDPPRALDTQR